MLCTFSLQEAMEGFRVLKRFIRELAICAVMCCGGLAVAAFILLFVLATQIHEEVLDEYDYEQMYLEQVPVPNDINAFVEISEGEIVLGAPDTTEDIGGTWSSMLDQARHRKTVAVSRFSIRKYPVTVGEYVEFLSTHSLPSVVESSLWPDYASRVLSVDGTNISAVPEFIHLPVCVTWVAAKAYCEWISQVANEQIRMPTEAEWEYVARGEEGREFPWGDGSQKHHAFYWQHHRKLIGLRRVPLSDVFLYPQGSTPTGVFDLIGNAAEWCNEKEEFHWPNGRQTKEYVLKGGQWVWEGHYAPSWRRQPVSDPTSLYPMSGSIRLVKSVPSVQSNGPSDIN